MDLNDKGINVIDDFARQSSAVIHDLIGFFDWLTKGAEKVAIKKLERFSVHKFLIHLRLDPHRQMR